MKRQLTIHADDLGMAHSVNMATFKAFDSGAVTAASVMAPCPWFPEAAEYARTHPERDIGIHLTFTSEWPLYGYRPLLGHQRVATLVGPDGCFWSNTALFVEHAKLRDVEDEARAQIELALSRGMMVRHIDCHMMALCLSPELFSLYERLAAEYKLHPFASFHKAIHEIHPGVDFREWGSHYVSLLEHLEVGQSALIVHLGYDNDELRAITREERNWGAMWRQLDWEVVMSREFGDSITHAQIELVPASPMSQK